VTCVPSHFYDLLNFFFIFIKLKSLNLKLKEEGLISKDGRKEEAGKKPMPHSVLFFVFARQTFPF
jgi:hypothetical protein